MVDRLPESTLYLLHFGRFYQFCHRPCIVHQSLSINNYNNHSNWNKRIHSTLVLRFLYLVQDSRKLCPNPWLSNILHSWKFYCNSSILDISIVSCYEVIYKLSCTLSVRQIKSFILRYPKKDIVQRGRTVMTIKPSMVANISHKNT